jgi:acyl-CoA synthetase (AMP-forming)/AMP-acid ligase II
VTQTTRSFIKYQLADEKGCDQLTAQLTGHGTHHTHAAASEQPYLARRQNWVNQLERHAYMQPGATALRFLGNTVTWAGLRDRVAKLAGALTRRGVGPGDRVMILMLNRTEFVESVLAATMIGAIAVPVNFRLTPPEIAFLVDDCEARLIITEPVLAAVAAGVRGVTSVLETIVVAGDSADEGLLAYEDLLNEPGEPAVPADVPNDSPALIMYTSGTTGRPKGAVLTHGNMTWNAANQLLGFDFTQTERTLALAPLFHIGGLNGTVNPTLLRGGCAVVVRRFDPAETLAVIEEQRVTSFFAVPTMLDAMARRPEFATRDLSALRTIGAAGAAVPLPTLRTWLERGVTMQQAYGMTEASPGCTVLDSADAVRKVGSAGKPVFFTDLRVVRPDGNQAAVDEVGEVVVQGPNIMAGYWNDPERTAQVLVDGWYRTGDAGSLDDEGFLYIRDRYRDMIISGGENVYPAEVESALLELPGVVEAAVIGTPDERWGEVGLAVLVVATGVARDPEAVRTALRERLAGFKVPARIEFADELPKTATGKIRKPDLRERYRP